MKQLIQKLFIEPTTNTLLQLFRYGFVGGVAFLFDYGSLCLLTEICHIYYLLSAAIAFAIGLTVNYLLSISWIFCKERTQKAWVEFSAFAIIGLCGLGFNEGIMYLFTDIMNIHYMLSKLISTGIVFFWNFFARKFFIFSKIFTKNNIK